MNYHGAIVVPVAVPHTRKKLSQPVDRLVQNLERGVGQVQKIFRQFVRRGRVRAAFT